VTDWESADDHNNRERINRARQAAEDLFKPRRAAASVSASTANNPPAVQQARRQPRVFAIPPRLPASAMTIAPAGANPPPQKSAPRRRSAAIPSSQLGRVRALATYGMTRAEVAELYGVTIEEIDQIVEEAAYKGQSR